MQTMRERNAKALAEINVLDEMREPEHSMIKAAPHGFESEIHANWRAMIDYARKGEG